MVADKENMAGTKKLPQVKMPRAFRNFHLALTLICHLVITFLFAAAVEAQVLSGSIRDISTGLGLDNIDLDVFDYATGSSVSIQGGRTNADGSFEVSLPAGGQYVLRADPNATQGYGAAYYGGTDIRAMSTPISVGADGEVEGLVIFLNRGFSVRGRVQNMSGEGLEEIDIDVFSVSGDFLSAYPARTDAVGDFTIGALPPGQYLVRADPSVALGQFYARAYFGDVLAERNATPVTVSANDLNDLTITVEAGGTISGQVSAKDGAGPLPNMDLDLLDASGALVPIGGRTDSLGFFEVGALPAGLYRLRIDPVVESGYARALYGASDLAPDGAWISVAAGALMTGVDVELSRGGLLSGAIRDTSGLGLVGIDLDVFDSDGARISLFDADSVEGGAFTLGLVPPGSYILRADPMASTGLAAKYNGGASILGLAVPITIGADEVRSGVDFVLNLGSTLAGSVVDREGAPIPDVDIDLWEATTHTRLRTSARTDGQGAYRLEGLNPGSYMIRADPSEAQGFAQAYFPDGISMDSAQVVEASEGSEADSINFELQRAAVITGRVFGPDGLPEMAVDIDLFAWETGERLAQNSMTDENGNFALTRLPAGDYFLRADPEEATGLASLYNGAAIDEDFAPVVTVAEGELRTGTNFHLNTAGSISGVIRDAAGSPVQGIDLDLWEATTVTRLGYSAETDVNGAYRIDGLNPGTYLIRADPVEAQGYARTYYSSGISLASCLPIAVSGGAVSDSVNFVLQPAASIAGFVVGPDGHPAVDVDIDIFSAGTMEKLDQNAATDGNGFFSLSSLPAGTYLLRAQPDPASGAISTALGGFARVANATPISVVAGQTATAPEIALLSNANPPHPVPSMSLHGYAALGLCLLLMMRKSIYQSEMRIPLR